MLKPGFIWDPEARTWKPVDYSSLSAEELALRREKAEDFSAEAEAQLKSLLPIADAQAILNKSMKDLQSLIITLAKKAPAILLGEINVTP